jgi:hypothetical protein
LIVDSSRVAVGGRLAISLAELGIQSYIPQRNFGLVFTETDQIRHRH